MSLSIGAGFSVGAGFTYITPIPTNWIVIAGGPYSTAAIQNNNTLWTIGQNAHGQLGNNTSTNFSSPIQVGAATSSKTSSPKFITL